MGPQADKSKRKLLSDNREVADNWFAIKRWRAVLMKFEPDYRGMHIKKPFGFDLLEAGLRHPLLTFCHRIFRTPWRFDQHVET